MLTDLMAVFTSSRKLVIITVTGTSLYSITKLSLETKDK